MEVQSGGHFADKGPGNHAGNLVLAVKNLAGLLAPAIQILQGHFAFPAGVRGNLEHAVRAGVDNRPAGLQVPLTQLVQNHRAGSRNIAQNPPDAGFGDEAIQHFRREAVGRGRKWRVQVNARHFPGARGGVLAPGHLGHLAVGAHGGFDRLNLAESAEVTKKVMTTTVAAATMVSECRSSAICDSVRGSTNVWLASTSDPSTSNPPETPNTPKPGITKISRPMQTNPSRKRTTPKIEPTDEVTTGLVDVGVVDPVGVAQADRCILYNTRNNSPSCIAIQPDLINELDHFRCRNVIGASHYIFLRPGKIQLRVMGSFNFTNPRNICANLDATFL